MAHIGHPLIGDRRYGGPNVVKFSELRELHGRKGHLLHAQKIEFNFHGHNFFNLKSFSVLD